MAAREREGEQEKGKPQGGENRRTFGDKRQAVRFHRVSISHKDDATANLLFASIGQTRLRTTQLGDAILMLYQRVPESLIS